MIGPNAVELNPREPAVPKNALKFGLRFRRGDALRLRLFEARIESGEIPQAGGIELYRNAAEAAERGEPLIVFCDRALEIEAMAQAFVALGFDRPTVDDLNPKRAAG